MGQLVKFFLFTVSSWQVVLDRGVMSYYKTQGHASANEKRRCHQHLNSAVVIKAPEDSGIFLIKFADGESHRLTLTPHCAQRSVERQVTTLF